MNIIRKELKMGLRVFLFWTIGLFFLDFAGMLKFKGIADASTSVNVMELMNKFPKVVLAVFGCVGLDMSTLGGYYGVLSFYSLVCISIYGIHLGASSVNREIVDKTYEFIFTRPRNRIYILQMKMISGIIFLTLFGFLNWLFTVMALPALDIKDSIGFEVILFSVAAWIVGVFFFSIGALCAAIGKTAEKGSLYGNLCFLAAFVLGLIFDMMEHGSVIRFFTPIKYFLPYDLLEHKFSMFYLIVCLLGTGGCIYGSFRLFHKRDLNAL